MLVSWSERGNWGRRIEHNYFVPIWKCRGDTPSENGSVRRSVRERLLGLEVCIWNLCLVEAVRVDSLRSRHCQGRSCRTPKEEAEPAFQRYFQEVWWFSQPKKKNVLVIWTLQRECYKNKIHFQMVEFEEKKDLKERILKSWSLCSWQKTLIFLFGKWRCFWIIGSHKSIWKQWTILFFPDYPLASLIVFTFTSDFKLKCILSSAFFIPDVHSC